MGLRDSLKNKNIKIFLLNHIPLTYNIEIITLNITCVIIEKIHFAVNSAWIMNLDD